MQTFTSSLRLFLALSLNAEKKMEKKKVGRTKQQLITNADL